MAATLFLNKQLDIVLGLGDIVVMAHTQKERDPKFKSRSEQNYFSLNI